MSELAQRDRLTIFLLVSALVVHNLHRSAVVPIFTELQAKLGTDYSGVGVLFAAYVLGYAITQLLMGMIPFRFAPRTLLVAGLVSSCILSAMFSVAGNLGWAIAIRFLLGMTGTLLYTPAMSMAITHFAPTARGRVMGLLQSGAGAGSVAALVLTPILCTALGTTGGLLMLSLATLVLAIVTAGCFPRSVEAPPRPVPTMPVRIYRQLLLWLLLAISFIGMLASYGLLTWMPTFMSTQYGYSPIAAGLLATIPVIALTLSAPLVGRLSDYRFGRGNVVMAGSAIALACFALLAISPGLAVVVVLSTLLGVSLAATTSPFMLLAAEQFHATAATRVVALLAAVAQGGATIAGVLFGALLSNGVSFGGVWIVCAVLAFLRISVLFLTMRTIRAAPP